MKKKVVQNTSIFSGKVVSPKRFLTGIDALDNQLTFGETDPGFEQGRITLLSGLPGCGKTTLLLQLLDGLAANGCFTVFATNEMSENDVRAKGKAMGLKNIQGIVEGLNATKASVILALAQQQHKAARRKPLVIGVDSLDNMEPGTQNHMLRAFEQIQKWAQDHNVMVFAINHLRKDGDQLLGAAKILQLAESHLQIRGGELRYLKNRYGPCGAVKGLQLTGKGWQFNATEEEPPFFDEDDFDFDDDEPVIKTVRKRQAYSKRPTKKTAKKVA